MFIQIFSRSNTQHRVVLLPEYPGQTPATNPALKSYRSGLPDFERMSEASCYYGLGQRLMEFESAVCRMEEAVQEGETDWAKLLSSLENARVELENMFSSAPWRCSRSPRTSSTRTGSNS